MMFNLRDAADRGVNVGTSCWTTGEDSSDRQTLTDMKFAWGKEMPVTTLTSVDEAGGNINEDGKGMKGKKREVA